MPAKIIKSMAGQIAAIPTCWRMLVWCARCGEQFEEWPQHHEGYGTGQGWSDTATWRRYLTAMGWTEGGTVCLTCSKREEADD